jgi:hypothetical protein
MTPSELGELDSLLQAAQLLRLSEQGRARDDYQGLAEQVDANGDKLDAFSLGILDGLLASHGARSTLLPLLIYLVKVSEHGPGAAALRATEYALAVESRSGNRRYVELGRATVERVLAGEPAGPGGYADLLLGELTRN